MKSDGMRAEINLPSLPSALPMARHFLSDLTDLAGFAASDAQRLVEAATEACANVIDHAYEPDEVGRLKVVGEVTATDLIVEVHDEGIPVDPEVADEEGLEVSRPRVSKPGGMQLIREAADRVEWVPRGRQGKALRLVRHRPQADVTQCVPETELTPLREDEPLAEEQSYGVRSFLPDDAVGISRCIYRAYGNTYLHEDCYYPERLVHLNRTGALVSVVATDEAGEVVGHYALERPDGGPVAERGIAVVHPGHRGRDLMGRMRVTLEEEARRLGLIGVYSQAVMRHAYSQRVNEQFGSDVCGILLGAGPKATFKGIDGAPTSERVSYVLYFSWVRKGGGAALHVPARHRELLERIYRGLEVAPVFSNGAAPGGPSTVDVRYCRFSDVATIQVRQIGASTTSEVRRAAADLTKIVGAQAIHLYVPLSQIGAAYLCEEAEQFGFFLAGVGPSFAADGDVVILQRLDCTIDVGALATASPFARELVDYVDAERQRVGQS